jgi:hypothetical protein
MYWTSAYGVGCKLQCCQISIYRIKLTRKLGLHRCCSKIEHSLRFTDRATVQLKVVGKNRRVDWNIFYGGGVINGRRVPRYYCIVVL